MRWFFVLHHTVEGPFTAEEFGRRVEEGVVGPETLVWRDGMPGWLPYQSVTADSPDRWTPEQWRERDVRTPVGPILRESWEWLWREPGPLMAVVLAGLALSGVAWMLGMGLSLLIPMAGGAMAALVVGPLNAGSQWALLARHRGAPLRMASLFRGFGPRYGQLALGQVVQSSILFVVAVPMIVGLAAMGIVSVLILRDPELLSPAVSMTALLGGAVLAIAGMVVYFYLVVAWLYAPLLVLDKGMDFWSAMELSRRVSNRHPWGFSWFLLVASTLAFAGVLVLGVGLLFSLPLGLQMIVVGYQRVYGGLAEAPPPQRPSSPSR